MHIGAKLSKRLLAISESVTAAEMIDSENPYYDREYAENILYNTLGPLTEHPKWVEKWDEKTTTNPPDDFVPGGAAPRWTPENLIFAYAGDPSLLDSYAQNPRSPKYGNRGGAPMYRLARKVASHYSRGTDPSFISDLYSNGFIALIRLMQPGYDKSIKPFIKFVERTVQSAMEHGVGGSNREAAAAGFENEFGHKGLKGLIDETDPDKIREAASVVKGHYRTQKSHDKSDDNPFGMFSAPYYKTLMRYANALDSGNEDMIENAREDIKQLLSEIEDSDIKIGGASTGLGQAIDTPDRKTSIGVSSIDVNDDNAKSAAGELADRSASFGNGEDSVKIRDTAIGNYDINYVLKIALENDLGQILSSSKKYTAMALSLGAKDGKIGGPMTVNELRFILRAFGHYASNYYGKGVLRKNVSKPRDARGWWSAGEDPEIEPLPVKNESVDPIVNGVWHSIWSRNGYEHMGPTDITIEMTEEIREFERYGIPTARVIKDKANGKVQAMSKVSVSNTIAAAKIKLAIVSDIYASDLGLRESKKSSLPFFDKIDSQIISETASVMVEHLDRVLKEDAKQKTRIIFTPCNFSNMAPVDSLEIGS